MLRVTEAKLFGRPKKTTPQGKIGSGGVASKLQRRDQRPSMQRSASHSEQKRDSILDMLFGRGEGKQSTGNALNATNEKRESRRPTKFLMRRDTTAARDTSSSTNESLAGIDKILGLGDMKRRNEPMPKKVAPLKQAVDWDRGVNYKNPKNGYQPWNM